MSFSINKGYISSVSFDSPCRVCSERSPECHGSCPRYAKYKKEYEEMKEESRKRMASSM